MSWENAAGTTTFHSFGYTYDASSNPPTCDAYDDVSLPLSLSKIVDFSYAYDDLDRLTESRQGFLNGHDYVYDADTDQIRQYTLDQLGNWTTYKIGHYDSGTSQLIYPFEQGRTYDTSGAGGANEIATTTGDGDATFAHDAAGNATEAIIGIQLEQYEPELHEMIYDAWNRLVEVTGQGEFVYDGLNRKARNLNCVGSMDFDYYYNTNWQVLEMQLSTNPQPACYQFVWCARYIDALLIRDEDDDLAYETDYGGGDLGMEGSGLETRQFYLQDAGYSTRYTLLPDATMGLACDYSPYGDIAAPGSHGGGGGLFLDQGTIVGSTVPGMFHGYEWDLVSCMHHVRNRSLNIATGRWQQRDPLGYADGMNLYEYVRSNPSAYLDAFGKKAMTAEKNPIQHYWYKEGRKTIYTRSATREVTNKAGVTETVQNDASKMWLDTRWALAAIVPGQVLASTPGVASVGYCAPKGIYTRRYVELFKVCDENDCEAYKWGEVGTAAGSFERETSDPAEMYPCGIARIPLTIPIGRVSAEKALEQKITWTPEDTRVKKPAFSSKPKPTGPTPGTEVYEKIEDIAPKGYELVDTVKCGNSPGLGEKDVPELPTVESSKVKTWYPGFD